MVIQEISPKEVLDGCRQTLGVAASSSGTIEDPLIAGLLRRAAGYLSPCSRTALRSALLESLQLLTDDNELADRLDDAIDWLLVGGDLLELHDVTTSDPAAKGTWVYPAPPGFVVRPSKNVFLIGTVPDQEMFLPPSLALRVKHEAFVRTIEQGQGEDLAKELRGYGLQEFPETLWLKSPRAEEPATMLSLYKRMLDAGGPSGHIVGLTIVDPGSAVRYYKGRWTEPTSSHTGMFVGRRPQEFGAPLWGLVLLEAGRAVRFLDLPKRQRSRWRGSDEAWLVQMAIDHCRSEPQRFARRDQAGEVRFDFFSPLPSWAQRRFMILGRSTPPERCLMSFVLPTREAQAEEQFLRNRLWLANVEEHM